MAHSNLFDKRPSPIRTGQNFPHFNEMRPEVVSDFNGGFCGQGLDAPEYMAAGACEFFTYKLWGESHTRGFPIQVKAVRP